MADFIYFAKGSFSDFAYKRVFFCYFSVLYGDENLLNLVLDTAIKGASGDRDPLEFGDAVARHLRLLFDVVV